MCVSVCVMCDSLLIHWHKDVVLVEDVHMSRPCSDSLMSPVLRSTRTRDNAIITILALSQQTFNTSTDLLQCEINGSAAVVSAFPIVIESSYTIKLRNVSVYYYK